MKMVLYCAVISLIYALSIVHGKPLQTKRYVLDDSRLISRDLDGRSAKRSEESDSSEDSDSSDDSDSSEDSESSDIINVPIYTCPDGWSLNGTSCYKLSKNYVTWEAARSGCLAEYSHLAEVTSEGELDFIYSEIPLGKAWIGLNDKSEEGSFVWDNSSTPVSFANWGPLEPSNFAGYDCVYMFYTSLNVRHGWVADNCANYNFYICERQGYLMKR